MLYHKVLPLTKGFIKNVLLGKFVASNVNGGGSTNNSKYSYSVWMRHLHYWSTVYEKLPKVVIDFGPGLTLGTGFAALLSGCEKVYAIDAVKYWSVEQNLKVFDELVEIFKNREKISENDEFRNLKPEIENYDFPHEFLTTEILNVALAPSRLKAIRDEIKNIDDSPNKYIKFYYHDRDREELENISADFLFSQAVLQHVDDLESIYRSMGNWINKDGLMSHSVDFKSFGTSKLWNGHWTYSDWEWRLVCGKKHIINRIPPPLHIKYIESNKFRILKSIAIKLPNRISRNKFDKNFRGMSTEELTISGLYYLAQKY